MFFEDSFCGYHCSSENLKKSVILNWIVIDNLSMDPPVASPMTPASTLSTFNINLQIRSMRDPVTTRASQMHVSWRHI